MQEGTLIQAPAARKGRKQNVTAFAYIRRKKKGGEFWSHVSLGKGITYTISAGTRNRRVALEFNRLHLIKVMREDIDSKKSIDKELEQIELQIS